jgi:SAM-dependent methyltransferase
LSLAVKLDDPFAVSGFCLAMKALFSLPSTVRRIVFKKQRALLPKILAQYPLGRIIFRASIALKRFSLSFGEWSQRAIEYPWVIESLSMVPKRGLILDVGCAESLLSHELIAKGFWVVGIDIRDCLFRDKHVMFIKRNVMDTRLPDNTFDAIVVVSTIEHIGLEPYGQTVKDDNGDLKVMSELKRILKPNGAIILTTPYVGGGLLRVNKFERAYNKQRLCELTRGLKIIRAGYFYPLRSGRRLRWLRLSKETMDKQIFNEVGIACLVLKKIADNEPSYPEIVHPLQSSKAS